MDVDDTIDVQGVVMGAWMSEMTPAKFATACRSLQPSAMLQVTDYLLRNAVIGSAVNDLLLDYLQQLLACKSVSVLSLMQKISTLENISTSNSLVLLPMLRFVKKNMNMMREEVEEKPYESCMSLLSVITWSNELLIQMLIKLVGGDKHLDVIFSVVSSCVQITSVLDNQMIKTLFIIKKEHSHHELFGLLETQVSKIKTHLQTLETRIKSKSEKSEDLINQLQSLITTCTRLNEVVEHTDSASIYFISNTELTIGSLVSLYTTVKMCCKHEDIVKYIIFYQQIQRYSWLSVIKELLLSSLTNIHTTLSEQSEYNTPEITSQLISFTIVRLPYLLSALKTIGHIDTSLIEESVLSVFNHKNLIDKLYNNNAVQGSELTLNSILNRIDILNELITRLVKFDLITSNFTQRVQTLRSQCNIPPPTHKNESRVRNVEEKIHTIVNQLTQIASVPDILGSGTNLINTLATISNDNLYEFLVGAANCQLLTQLLRQLVRVNIVSYNSCNNETSVKLFDLTLIVIVEILTSFKTQDILNFLPITPNTFISQVISLVKHEPITRAADNVQSVISGVIQTLISGTHITGKWSHAQLTESLPYVYIELCKALTLQVITLQDVQKLTDKVFNMSYGMSLISYLQLVNYSRTAQPNLLNSIREIMNSLSQPAHKDAINRDLAYKSLCLKMKSHSGLVSGSSQGEIIRPANSECLLTTVNKILDSVVLERGFISPVHYIRLDKILRVVDDGWLLQQMMGTLFKSSYIEDTARVVAVLHMISHLSLSNVSKHYLSIVMPDLIQKTMKPTLLAENRCQSVCQLIVWTLAATAKKTDSYLSRIIKLLEPLYELMERITIRPTSNQATYLLQIFIQNIVEIGQPVSTQLLATAPINMLANMLSSEPRMLSILSSRKDLTPSDIDLITHFLCGKLTTSQLNTVVKSES